MQISDSESLVMDVLWQRAPRTSEDVIADLASSQQWQEATVKTLLNRLLKKGAITAEKDGRRYLYAPVLQRGDWVLDESESLLDRLFGGRVAPLVAHFSQHRKLSRKDIAELRQLLEEIDDGKQPLVAQLIQLRAECDHPHGDVLVVLRDRTQFGKALLGNGVLVGAARE